MDRYRATPWSSTDGADGLFPIAGNQRRSRSSGHSFGFSVEGPYCSWTHLSHSDLDIHQSTDAEALPPMPGEGKQAARTGSSSGAMGSHGIPWDRWDPAWGRHRLPSGGVQLSAPPWLPSHPWERLHGLPVCSCSASRKEPPVHAHFQNGSLEAKGVTPPPISQRSQSHATTGIHTLRHRELSYPDSRVIACQPAHVSAHLVPGSAFSRAAFSAFLVRLCTPSARSTPAPAFFQPQPDPRSRAGQASWDGSSSAYTQTQRAEPGFPG